MGDLAVLEPCLFPALVVSKDDSKSVESVHQSLNDKSVLDAFCQQHGVRTAHVFQVAWALMLQTYIGTDSISYAYYEGSPENMFITLGADPPAALNLMIYDTPAGSTISIVETVKSHALNEDLQLHPPFTLHHGSNVDQSRERPVNTALFIRNEVAQSLAAKEKNASYNAQNEGDVSHYFRIYFLLVHSQLD